MKNDNATTTIRANVTQEEHTAIKHAAKYKTNSSIDWLVKTAVAEYIKRITGKSLDDYYDEIKNYGKLIQGELF